MYKLIYLFIFFVISFLFISCGGEPLSSGSSSLVCEEATSTNGVFTITEDIKSHRFLKITLKNDGIQEGTKGTTATMLVLPASESAPTTLAGIKSYRNVISRGMCSGTENKLVFFLTGLANTTYNLYRSLEDTDTTISEEERDYDFFEPATDYKLYIHSSLDNKITEHSFRTAGDITPPFSGGPNLAGKGLVRIASADYLDYYTGGIDVKLGEKYFIPMTYGTITSGEFGYLSINRDGKKLFEIVEDKDTSVITSGITGDFPSWKLVSFYKDTSTYEYLEAFALGKVQTGDIKNIRYNIFYLNSGFAEEQREFHLTLRKAD